MRCALAGALLVLQLAAPAHALVVCADPNNLPFSNRAGQGFENKLVRLLARDLHTSIQYVWWAQRRGFARHTLTPQGCDLWPGVASGVHGLKIRAAADELAAVPPVLLEEHGKRAAERRGIEGALRPRLFPEGLCVCWGDLAVGALPWPRRPPRPSPPGADFCQPDLAGVRRGRGACRHLPPHRPRA